MPGEPIVVVEDNETNLRLVTYLLTSRGYEVRSARDAQELFQTLQSFRPRLILMDIQLPRMDGYELTRKLKADPATREILIIALTAFAMKGDEEKALAAGCDGYITKPIDTRLLTAKIAQYLSGPAP
jgi:CheY-like chemotaxis protein